MGNNYGHPFWRWKKIPFLASSHFVPTKTVESTITSFFWHPVKEINIKALLHLSNTNPFFFFFGKCQVRPKKKVNAWCNIYLCLKPFCFAMVERSKTWIKFTNIFSFLYRRLLCQRHLKLWLLPGKTQSLCFLLTMFQSMFIITLNQVWIWTFTVNPKTTILDSTQCPLMSRFSGSSRWMLGKLRFSSVVWHGGTGVGFTTFMWPRGTIPGALRIVYGVPRNLAYLAIKRDGQLKI